MGATGIHEYGGAQGVVEAESEKGLKIILGSLLSISLFKSRVCLPKRLTKFNLNLKQIRKKKKFKEKKFDRFLGWEL